MDAVDRISRAMLIERLASRIGKDIQDTENLLDVMLDTLAEALTTGEEVDLGLFGKFCIRNRVPKQDENSPRQPKQSYKIVVFKESSALKKKLRQTN